MSNVNRHGNNLHPDLPECPGCGGWHWQTNTVEIGHGARCWYSCTSKDCDVRALVVLCGLGLVIMWPCPLDERSMYTVHPKAAEWLDGACRLLRAADVNACTFGGQEPPTSIPLPVRPDGWPCYYGWREWHYIEMGQTVDVASLFAERVAKLRAAEEARAS